MDRRGFAALIGAGLLFPRNLWGALAKPQSQGIPRLSPQLGCHLYCLGTAWEPVYVEQLVAIDEAFLKCKKFHLLPQELQDIPMVGYELDFSPERLTIVLGNDDRPAGRADLDEYQAEWLKLGLCRDWTEQTIFTNHTVYPYRIHPECTLHHSPMVINHKWAAEAVEQFAIMEAVPPKWSNSFEVPSYG